MNPVDLFAVGFPTAVTILVLIGFYKVFVKKKSVSLFSTPFDQVTGQTEVEFHEEQEMIVEDEDQGDGKK
jgi:MFS superfamily sulfate permease-like transporter